MATRYVKRPRRVNPLTIRAQVAIRDMILAGDLPHGYRISEMAMAARLGLSRTPIRAALARLHAEGLITAISSGGHVVNPVSEREIYDRIEVRGVLEGLTVRLAAERGVSPRTLLPLERCLDAIDEIVQREALGGEDFEEYVQLNARFHQLLRPLAGSGVVTRQIVRAGAVPYASPTALSRAEEEGRARSMLMVAQAQHRAVLEAISAREGARAEELMREHSRGAGRSLAPLLAARAA